QPTYPPAPDTRLRINPTHGTDLPLNTTEQHQDTTKINKQTRQLRHTVVVLRHWEQMSTNETAAALGMAPGTVKSTLHRALAQLRQELQHRDPDSASPAAGTANPPTESPTGTITAPDAPHPCSARTR
ncbi:MAG: hypothetical protein JF597_03730, partial [Streptomyces sp.]|nr:hypothetical protein [Streptomyces sp.]